MREEKEESQLQYHISNQIHSDTNFAMNCHFDLIQKSHVLLQEEMNIDLQHFYDKIRKF